MSAGLVVLDLGVGNLGNVERALRAAGGAPRRSDDPAVVRAARQIVLPGVGAFRPPRERLRGALEEALRAALSSGAWLLGICVGYQLLFERSDEFGATDGLALLPGTVTELPAATPLPHIGWNRLAATPAGAGHPLLAGLCGEAYVYFVHSYAPDSAADGAALATTLHGRSFAAVAAAPANPRVMGAQFHPEKSGDAGLKILSNFLALSNGVGEWS